MKGRQSSGTGEEFGTNEAGIYFKSTLSPHKYLQDSELTVCFQKSMALLWLKLWRRIPGRLVLHVHVEYEGPSHFGGDPDLIEAAYKSW
jgi:hypothetical protein